MRPFDWNCVILGAWNRAIFTPRWVARELLGLAEALPVEVKVQIDVPGPMMISHEGISVLPSGDRLLLNATSNARDDLLRAARVATRALELLSVTPVFAGGVNIRYRFERGPDELRPLLDSALDEPLSERQRVVSGRMLKRAMDWNMGSLNFELLEPADLSAILLFNFERVSTDHGHLQEWFRLADEMLTEAREFMTTVLQLPTEDLPE